MDPATYVKETEARFSRLEDMMAHVLKAVASPKEEVSASDSRKKSRGDDASMESSTSPSHAPRARPSDDKSTYASESNSLEEEARKLRQDKKLEKIHASSQDHHEALIIRLNGLAMDDNLKELKSVLKHEAEKIELAREHGWDFVRRVEKGIKAQSEPGYETLLKNAKIGLEVELLEKAASAKTAPSRTLEKEGGGSFAFRGKRGDGHRTRGKGSSYRGGRGGKSGKDKPRGAS